VSSCFGQYLHLSLFGQSHGAAIGISMDGFPAGFMIDMEQLSKTMKRRTPGQNAMTTPRKEADEPEFLSGVWNGRTTGQPLCAIIRNTNQHSRDYGDAVDLLRPGHADYSGHIRYFGFEDFRGGGHFSARLTAPIVLAGALCEQYLASKGVEIACHIKQLGSVVDASWSDGADADTEVLKASFLPTLTPGLAEEMEKEIMTAREKQDSVGGILECRVTGLPAGLGAPFFDSVESVLSHLLFSVPAVKGVEFGAGFGFATLPGSRANDSFYTDGKQIRTKTNNSGGVNGGITNGMPLIFRCCVRATPSISREQETVSIRQMEDTKLSIHGRHDPCVLPRAVPIVEAITAIGLMELWKERAACL